MLTISQTTKALVKDARDVFKRWIQIQQVIPDRDFASLTEQITPAFIEDFKTSYEINLPIINKQLPFLTTLSNGLIDQYGYQIRYPLDEFFVSNLQKIYQLADTDVAALLNFLDALKLFEQTKTSGISNNLVDQCTGVTQLLFSGQTETSKVELMFNLANRFAEFAFGELFPTVTQRMLVDKSQHQKLRYLFSVIWQKLAGYGWKNWHETALNNLATHAANGKTVVYIAGGSDLYQLIKKGVYNIINIDPQLPSQPTYYTNDWEFLLNGEINDQIIFNDESTKIIMVRTSYKRTGKQFQATLANNKKVLLDESETIWNLYSPDGKNIGKYTLKRRYCNQNDFILQDNEVMLMSFNELHYICMPQNFGATAPGNHGWGIDLTQLPSSFNIYVKQLRTPLSQSMLINMHTATMLNTVDLGYISLGSCIN